MHLRFILLLLSIFLLCACGKWIVGKNPANTPTGNYQALYENVRDNYAFFEEKQINWDSIDRVYRPLVSDSLKSDSLFRILSLMLGALGDGHVNLYSATDRSRNWDWYLDYDANFNESFLRRQVWSRDLQITGPFTHMWMDSIGYVYYGSFSSAIAPGHLNYVLKRYAKAKGIIIDVRENGGGSLSNVFSLVRRFIPQRTFFGTIDYKAGPQPKAFSRRDSFLLEPFIDFAQQAEEQARHKARGKQAAKDTSQAQKIDSSLMFLDKPVVILTNRLSYSATNFFAAFMSMLPNVTLIGDQTGGGGGLPISYELPNGWKYRISATRTYLSDGRNIESGIPPDIAQGTGPQDELAGKDAIIERAKKWIREGL